MIPFCIAAYLSCYPPVPPPPPIFVQQTYGAPPCYGYQRPYPYYGRPVY